MTEKRSLIKHKQGRSLLINGYNKEAVAACTKTISKRPEQRDAYYVRAPAYRRLGMEQEAKSDIEFLENQGWYEPDDKFPWTIWEGYQLIANSGPKPQLALGTVELNSHYLRIGVSQIIPISQIVRCEIEHPAERGLILDIWSLTAGDETNEEIDWRIRKGTACATLEYITEDRSLRALKIYLLHPLNFDGDLTEALLIHHTGLVNKEKQNVVIDYLMSREMVDNWPMKWSKDILSYLEYINKEHNRWRLIKDNIRNTRFEFYEYLSEAGVDIQWMRQEGMITASEISGNSKIKQVKFTRNEYSQVEGSDVKTGWKVWYLVPAVNLSPLRLKLVRKRKFLLFGKVIGMKWRMQMDNGKIHKTSKKELHRYLRHDSALMARLTRCFETIEIVSDMYSLCWNLNDGREVVMEGKSYAPDSNVLQELTPGKEEWECYQEIASLLLKAPPVSYDMWLDGREWWST